MQVKTEWLTLASSRKKEAEKQENSQRVKERERVWLSRSKCRELMKEKRVAGRKLMRS